MALSKFEAEIRTAFEQLREQRQGLPVYGLEHGLTAAQIPELKRALGHLVRYQSGDSSFRKFPLSVVACSSEIGYEYRGTGTDFWPKLEAEIAAGIDEAAKEAHTKAFRYAQKKFGLKSPPDTPWARNFRHISWPISNAIAAKEIHRPLATALRRTMTFAFANASIEELVARLTIEARSEQNTRLTEWLQHTDVAAALISRLLELPLEENAVEIVSLDRIVADLEADPIARQSVAAASERRKAASSKRSIPEFRVLIILNASGVPRSALQVPGLDGAEIEVIKRALAKVGGKVELAEGGCSLKTVQLVPGALLDLQMASFHSLLSGSASLKDPGEIPFDLFNEIESLMPRISDPMVFVEDSLPGSFGEWKSERRIPKGRRIVLATSRDHLEPDGLAPLAEADGVRFFEVEIPSTAGELHLSMAGAKVETDPVFELSGGIPLYEGLRGPVFSRGMPVLLKRCDTSENGDWTVRSSAVNPLTLASNDIGVLLDETPEHQKIEVETDEAKVAMEIDFFSAEERSRCLSIKLDPASPSVEDIQRGQLRIQIFAPLELEDAQVAIGVTSGSKCLASSSGKVPRLPATIGASSELIQSLADQLVEAAPARSAHLFLEVSLHGVWSKRWHLDWDPVQVNWLNNDGAWYALSEEQELEVFQSAVARPLSRADYEKSRKEEATFRVLFPQVDGQPVYLGSICDGPKAFKPEEIAPLLPTETTRAMSGRENVAGFEETLHSYLLWTTARPVHPVAALASLAVSRRIESLLVQQLCGRSWVGVERRSEFSAGSLYDVLATQAVETGLAAGGEFPSVPAKLLAAFDRTLSAKLASAWPNLSADMLDIDFDKFAEAMDGAVAETYEELAVQLVGEEANAFGDVDPFSEPAKWQSALNTAIARMSGSLLSRKILPAERGEQLQTWDYSLPQAQLVSLLLDIHTDVSPRGQKKWIRSSNIQDCLHLWIEPPELLKEDEWMESISSFLQDRQTARAVRYAALRYRAAHSMAYVYG